MKSEKITEKIEFLVDKWIDEAHIADIIDYARERLTNYYLNLGDDIVEELYEEQLELWDA